MRWPTTRAMMSLGPPGGNGTISRIGFAGKSCAEADTGDSRTTNPISTVCNILMQASRRRDDDQPLVVSLANRGLYGRIGGKEGGRRGGLRMKLKPGGA